MRTLRAGHLKVHVATLTRRRANLLAECLASWQKVELPPNCTVTFLVVENDDADLSSETVRHASSPERPINYVLETELGIPFGRNRAAKEAISAGSDLLIFMDDDEIAAGDWLVCFLEGYRNSEAVLIGAPLRARAPDLELSLWQGFLYKSVKRRYENKEARARRRADLSGTRGVTIVTNNWLGEVSLFRDHDIWFDERMRFTGGTDAKFHHDARRDNHPTAWAVDAIVYETITPERLSFVYQLKRARDQSNTNLRRKLEQNPTIAYKTIPAVIIKFTAALLLALLVPFTLGRTLLPFARTLGWVLGRVAAIGGYRSNLYLRTTGN